MKQLTSFSFLAALALWLPVAPTLAETSAPRILMVVTSHDRIDEAHPTGLWLEEFATPYEMFLSAGYQVTVASTRGGTAPLDPRSLGDRDKYQASTVETLERTIPLAELALDEFAAVFFPGGHGTMYDLPVDKKVGEAVVHFLTRQQPVALVCHGPAALVGATLPDGTAAVAGRRVTAFTNEEERAVELDDDMPFLLESKLIEQGANFAGAENFIEHVVVDGNLITGQNPASSAAAAHALLQQLAAPVSTP